MDHKDQPTISVIMGIYNCAGTLAEALDSLLAQTYQDFSVILCDDGSTDDTAAIAKAYLDAHPDRFTLLTNAVNRGLNYTLNKCLMQASGRYIARMDGDDISLPRRFFEQVRYLDEHPEIAFVSSAMIVFDEAGDWGINASMEYPQAADLVRGRSFSHAACMVRREAYLAVDGYSVHPRLLRVEDYHLWIKLYAKGYRGHNLGAALYKMRDDRNAARRRTLKARLNEMYVKHLAIQTLDLPRHHYIFLLKPLMLAFVPRSIYERLHRARMKVDLSENGLTPDPDT